MLFRSWDHHQDLENKIKTKASEIDKPLAALFTDLKQRGMLDSTLVIWGGEFGRTPFCQGDINDKKTLGRDHHPYVFTIWMAGGGVQHGFTYGVSDDFADNPAKAPSTSTTLKRRCCTSSASTTNASPTNSKAATSV